jgi:hypothetical protein
MLANPALTSGPAPAKPAGEVIDRTMESSIPPAPTRAPLQDRRASPNELATSGMERAMAQHADRVHPVRRRK